MAIVPYTITYTDADIIYLGNRLGSSPAIAQILNLGTSTVDLRQLTQKLDNDPGISDTDYEATVVDD